MESFAEALAVCLDVQAKGGDLETALRRYSPYRRELELLLAVSLKLELSVREARLGANRVSPTILSFASLWPFLEDRGCGRSRLGVQQLIVEVQRRPARNLHLRPDRLLFSLALWRTVAVGSLLLSWGVAAEVPTMTLAVASFSSWLLWLRTFRSRAFQSV